MKQHLWIYLESYIHITIKSSKALLYNTLDSKSLIYDDKSIIRLLKRLSKKDSLYVTSIEEKATRIKSIKKFITDIRNNFFGDLYNSEFSKKKPIQLVPNITDDFNKNNYNLEGIEPAKHLSKVNIYLNNFINEQKHFLKNAHKQFIYPISGKKYMELSISQVDSIFKFCSSNKQICINLSGGNIFKYSNYTELLNLVDFLSPKIIYNIHILDLEQGKIKDILIKNTKLNILVDFKTGNSEVYKKMKSLNNKLYKTTFTFIIQNEDEYNLAEKMVQDFALKNYEYKPYFNGNNIDFFEENIFMDTESILSSQWTMKEILANTIINPLNYGEITIIPNSNIYSNINKHKIGNLNNDKLSEIIYKQVFIGKYWKLSRNKVHPCKECVYSDICAPISNYEHVIGKFNLCKHT